MTDPKINQLHTLQQTMQNTAVQKQQVAAQLSEIEAALTEVAMTEKVYKFIGNIMVVAKKEDVQKELAGKKDVLELRVKNLEKQETRLRERCDSLQNEVLKTLKK